MGRACLMTATSERTNNQTAALDVLLRFDEALGFFCHDFTFLDILLYLCSLLNNVFPARSSPFGRSKMMSLQRSIPTSDGISVFALERELLCHQLLTR